MTIIKHRFYYISFIQASRHRQDIQLCSTRHCRIRSYRASRRDPWIVLFLFEVGFRRGIGQYVSLGQWHPFAILTREPLSDRLLNA